jgi:L-ribulose-5-phosphate 4-epimerase
MLEALKNEICKSNRELERLGLVTLTWGNVSGFDHEQELMVIKPSGVPYAELHPEDMVVVDLHGNVVEGTRNPSSDSPTHLILYRSFRGIGGIVHTHSTHATMFCQAARELPCYGTTHADHFCGTVPVARGLTAKEVNEDYEGHTGNAIVACFENVDAVTVPAVLVAHHAPFTWGTTPGKAVENSIALEACAKMAIGSLQLEPGLQPIPGYVLDKHFQRKHGPGASYGQPGC